MNTEEIKINGTLVFTINSKQHWINSFPGALPKIPKSELYLWIDAQGNILTQGEDFINAQKINSYPVRIYLIQRVSHIADAQHKENIFKLIHS